MANVFKWFGNQAKAFVDKEIENRQLAAGRAIVARARELVPVRTGNLRNSIGFTYRQSDHVLSIHADEPYAVFVEYGTRFMAARPFLRPAINEAAHVWGKHVMAFPNAPMLKGTNRKPNEAAVRHNRAMVKKHESGLFSKARRSGVSVRRGQWNGPKRPWHPKENWTPPVPRRWDDGQWEQGV